MLATTFVLKKFFLHKLELAITNKNTFNIGVLPSNILPLQPNLKPHTYLLFFEEGKGVAGIFVYLLIADSNSCRLRDVGYQEWSITRERPSRKHEPITAFRLASIQSVLTSASQPRS